MQTSPHQPSRHIFCAVLLTCLALSACTSQSRKTSSNLDMNHPRYASRECQMALGRAQLHDNIKQSRVMASPVAVLLSGGSLLLPVLAVNAGLDTVDHLEASDISVYCGGPETPNGEIAKEVLMGVGFGMEWASKNTVRPEPTQRSPSTPHTVRPELVEGCAPVSLALRQAQGERGDVGKSTAISKQSACSNLC